MQNRSISLAECTKGPFSGSNSTRRPLQELVVLVVEDAARLSQAIQPICEFIGLRVEIAAPEDDIAALVRDVRPISIITQLDTPARDCCNVMKAAAAYDASLPILIVAEEEDALLGVVDAVEDLLGLKSVSKVRVMPGCGLLADFLFGACRKYGRLGLLPI